MIVWLSALAALAAPEEEPPPSWSGSLSVSGNVNNGNLDQVRRSGARGSGPDPRGSVPGPLGGILRPPRPCHLRGVHTDGEIPERPPTPANPSRGIVAWAVTIDPSLPRY